MIEITMQAEILLRTAKYDTWAWPGGSESVTCFENESLIGFLHVFPSGETLLSQWEQAQKNILNRYSGALRTAGTKAWNVYSVFLTKDDSPSYARQIERIEEDFTLTRKIARGAVQTSSDLALALLPLMPVRAQPALGEEEYAERLRSRLKDVPNSAVAAFLGNVSAVDVAHILESEP